MVKGRHDYGDGVESGGGLGVQKLCWIELIKGIQHLVKLYDGGWLDEGKQNMKNKIKIDDNNEHENKMNNE
jgi:hypothetical protein